MMVLPIRHFCCAYCMYCVALLRSLVFQNPPSDIPTLVKQSVVSFSLDFSLDHRVYQVKSGLQINSTKSAVVLLMRSESVKYAFLDE